MNWGKLDLKKQNIDTVQVNLGNRCNLSCRHCHIEASPKGDKNMNAQTAMKIIKKLNSSKIKNVEFTGGEPELNPVLDLFISGLKNKNIIVRTNLTVLSDKSMEKFINLYKKNNVKIVGSLPGLSKEPVESQRGAGVFKKSIAAIKKLNKAGFGNNGLILDLVYNPNSDFLPDCQDNLKSKFKQILKRKYKADFNDLAVIVNVPIKRFKTYLSKNNAYNDYMNLLKDKFNPATLKNVMCRKLVSVDYKGDIYDCDFNLAENKKISNKKFWDINIDNFSNKIKFNNYCYACTVNSGSSCHGEVISKTEVQKDVSEYYGEVLTSSNDLKTSACCTSTSMPDHIKKALSMIADEIIMKYYGCGSPIPLQLSGCTCLDIGCGTGRDVYVMSKLAGQKGQVYGIDMTDKQINVAKKYINAQMKNFNYNKPNVFFIKDFIENLDKHFKNNYFDVITSNCVFNLIESKSEVLKKIFDILKNGGEFYFSDVYCDRRLPDKIRKNKLLYNECLGGAMYYQDFERLARKTGFADPRRIEITDIDINDKAIKKLVGNAKFCSITYRLWKIEGLEDDCEDFGHIAIYKGGMENSEYKFQLDDGHLFEKNKPERVCGNTAKMLSETRFKKYFKIIGNFKEHFGKFRSCSNTDDKKQTDDQKFSSGCCC